MKFHGVLLCILLGMCLVVDTHSYVMTNRDIMRRHERLQEGSHTAATSSSSSSNSVTLYTSGVYQSKPLFDYSKQVISESALVLFSRLPKNKTGLNFTDIYHQINPNVTKGCNDSKIPDVCANILVASLLTTGQPYNAPPLWLEMILTLVVIGGKAIKHFSDYGCLGRMSISAQGVDFTPVPANSCPEIPKGVEQQQMSLSSGVENDKMCWKMLFANGGNSDYYPNCIMSDPSFQLGVILAFTVPFYAIRKSRLTAYQDEAYQQAKNNFLHQLENAGDSSTLAANFDTLSYQLTKVDPTNAAEEIYEYNRGVQSGERQYNHLFAKVQKDADELDLSSEQLNNILLHLEEAASEIGNEDALNLIQRLKSRLQANRERNIPDSDVSSDPTSDTMRSMTNRLEECALLLAVRPGGGESCDQVFQDMSSEGMMEDTIQSSSVPSNNAIINSMAESLPEDNIKGRAAEMDTEDIAKAIGVGGEVSGIDFMSSVASMLFPFVNFMFMMNIFENVLHNAVASVMTAINTGLKETMQALEKLSKQETLQFNSTINIIESKVNEMEANIDCRLAWSNIIDDLYTLSDDYTQMRINHNQCRTRLNLTGSDYFKCQQENFVDKPSTNWHLYQDFGNMGGADWSTTRLGMYAKQCVRFHVIKGYSPEDIASFTEQTYEVATSAIRKSGILYRWTAAMAQGINKYFGDGYMNNTEEILDGFKFSRNNTKSFTKWYIDTVVPPAIAGYMKSSIWQSVGLLPPQMVRYQVNILSRADYTPRGYLAPLLWLPEDETSSKELAYATQSPYVPKLMSTITVSNVTSVKNGATAACESIQCLFKMCKCQATSTDGCVCAGKPGCKCSYDVFYTYTVQYPARGWVGPYSNTTGEFLPKGIPLCTSKDTKRTSQCIPGVFIQNLNGNGLKLWMNATHDMKVPVSSQFEYTSLAKVPEVGKRNVDALIFQTYDANWAWKYGSPTYADYLSRYYEHTPYKLLNIFSTLSNSSALFDGDGWRYNFVIGYKDPVKGFEYHPVRVTNAQTVSLPSETSFGFNCKQTIAQKVFSQDCLPLIGRLPYPGSLP